MEITLSNLNTKDLATLAQRTVAASQTGKYQVVEGHPLLQNLIARYADYDAVYTKLTYSGKGIAVAEADEKRDRYFAGIKSYLSGFMKLPELEFHEDAAALQQIFRVHGLNLNRMSYSAQTAQLKKLLEELDKPENTARLTNLKLATIFAQLKTSQTDFENLYREQAEANGELRNLPSATSVRKTLEKALRDYLNLLTAMRDVEDWKMLYNDISEIVKAAKNSTVKKTPIPPSEPNL
jgi:MarR-like DNA-binding transcriptional regulator SgrR of sgrS sRNA